MRSLSKAPIAALALLLCGSIAAESQRPPLQPPAPTPKQVYGHFFNLVAAVERDADDADKKGDKAKAKTLHTHFQKKLGLTDQDAATLKSHASAADDAVRKQDAKAHDVIDRIRKKTPGGKLAPGEKPPAVPQELLNLQTGRDRMITDHIAGLQHDLGGDAFTRIDTFAKTLYPQTKHIAPRKPIAPPRFPAKQ